MKCNFTKRSLLTFNVNTDIIFMLDGNPVLQLLILLTLPTTLAFAVIGEIYLLVLVLYDTARILCLQSNYCYLIAMLYLF